MNVSNDNEYHTMVFNIMGDIVEFGEMNGFIGSKYMSDIIERIKNTQATKLWVRFSGTSIQFETIQNVLHHYQEITNQFNDIELIFFDCIWTPVQESQTYYLTGLTKLFIHHNHVDDLFLKHVQNMIQRNTHSLRYFDLTFIFDEPVDYEQMNYKMESLFKTIHELQNLRSFTFRLLGNLEPSPVWSKWIKQTICNNPYLQCCSIHSSFNGNRYDDSDVWFDPTIYNRNLFTCRHELCGPVPGALESHFSDHKKKLNNGTIRWIRSMVGVLKLAFASKHAQSSDCFSPVQPHAHTSSIIDILLRHIVQLLPDPPKWLTSKSYAEQRKLAMYLYDSCL